VHRYAGGKAIGVHFGNARRPQQIDTGVAQGLAVLRQLARIGGQILVDAELQRIDENRHHHAVCARARLAHQRQMAFVQRTHRRDQREGFSPAFEHSHGFAQLRAGRDGLHGPGLSFTIGGEFESVATGTTANRIAVGQQRSIGDPA